MHYPKFIAYLNSNYPPYPPPPLQFLKKKKIGEKSVVKINKTQSN